MSILEAMAAGCPIIASDVGGISIAVEHEINGSLIKPGSSEKLSDEIQKLLANKELRQKYSFNSSKIFNKKFSAETMMQKYEKLYLRKDV